MNEDILAKIKIELLEVPVPMEGSGDNRESRTVTRGLMGGFASGLLSSVIIGNPRLRRSGRTGSKRGLPPRGQTGPLTPRGNPKPPEIYNPRKRFPASEGGWRSPGRRRRNQTTQEWQEAMGLEPGTYGDDSFQMDRRRTLIKMEEHENSLYKRSMGQYNRELQAGRKFETLTRPQEASSFATTKIHQKNIETKIMKNTDTMGETAMTDMFTGQDKMLQSIRQQGMVDAGSFDEFAADPKQVANVMSQLKGKEKAEFIQEMLRYREDTN